MLQIGYNGNCAVHQLCIVVINGRISRTSWYFICTRFEASFGDRACNFDRCGAAMSLGSLLAAGDLSVLVAEVRWSYELFLQCMYNFSCVRVIHGYFYFFCTCRGVWDSV